jgi:hypothetical protein
VFAGDWTLEAAAAVCADGDIVLVQDVLDLFVGLVRKSLVVATVAADGMERYDCSRPCTFCRNRSSRSLPK